MRVSGSIRAKLIASTVAVLAAIIAVTTTHSRGRQLGEMVASQQHHGKPVRADHFTAFHFPLVRTPFSVETAA